MENGIENISGTYFYFIDLVDEKSSDYNKILSLKANDIDDAWNKVLKRHASRYYKTLTIDQVKKVYKFHEQKEIA